MSNVSRADELPGLLVDTSWLYQHLDDPGVRIVDAGSPDGYAKAHIPNSVSIPHNYIKDTADATHVMPPDQFSQLMGQLGIGDDTHVVVYDHNFSLTAARLWWVLNYYGHSRCSVVDGGWLKWLEESRPVAFRPSTFSSPGPFTPRANAKVFCSMDYLKAGIDNPDIIILDVRSGEEHTGEALRSNKRGGHIPGAIHLEWRDVMDPPTHTFKPAEELRRMFAQAGIEPDKEVITY